LLTKEFIYVANVGDSRGIGIARAVGGKYKSKTLSKDHKPSVNS
jgi:serine/threonine protein phosphatase PrpC